MDHTLITKPDRIQSRSDWHTDCIDCNLLTQSIVINKQYITMAISISAMCNCAYSSVDRISRNCPNNNLLLFTHCKTRESGNFTSVNHYLKGLAMSLENDVRKRITMFIENLKVQDCVTRHMQYCRHAGEIIILQSLTIIKLRNLFKYK